MHEFCGECARWTGSIDIDRNGRRWCFYSHRYEEASQNENKCMCFIYDGCPILTKLCEILNEPIEKWFEAYEAVKESFVAPEHMEWLSAYCSLGPQIADKLDMDEKREQIAEELMQEYLKPAYALWQDGENEKSAAVYKEMIAYMAMRYYSEYTGDGSLC